MKPVIAIDGPAGAGKSTVSKIIAHKLGLRYLDTGAMYRCIAFKVLSKNIGIEEVEVAAEILDETIIDFGVGEPQPVFLDGVNVTAEIRTPEIGEAASTLSQFSPIRQRMVERQQSLCAEGGVILEGRDVTTVVAPNATVKVYLTASLEERTRRRREEFNVRGLTTKFEEVRTQIEQRDHRDINRDDSPLTVADDAHVIESAGMSAEQIADKIIALVK
jgi:CMP/dCMP kinase